MADNVTFQTVLATPPDATVIATDDCAGAQVQIVKQAIATDGSATLIPATAADGLLVNLGVNNDVTAVISGVVDVGDITGTVSLPTGAATAAKQDTGNASLSSLDGKVTACNTGAVVVSSLVPGTGATNLGKAEDAAHTSGDVGVLALMVRQDADAAMGADGDYTPLQTDANGYLKVNIKAGAGSGGTSATDDAAFTAAAGSGTPMMGFVTADSVDSGDVGVIGMLANRQQKVTLYDSAGVEVSVGGGTQYAQGTVGTTTDVLTMAGAVRKDTAAIASGVIDGDRAVLSTDSVGRLRVTAADTTQPVSGTVSATVSGTVAATQSGTWTVQPGNTANTTAWKVDGSAVTQPVSGTFWQATQPVSAAALPLPSGASTLAEQQTQTASLSVMDDWDETDRAKVNVIVGQAGITAGAGAVAANTPRVTHASDDPVTTSVQLLDDTVATTASAIPSKGLAVSGTDGTNARVLKTDTSGELQVDVLTMPTVTVSGTVAATQSGTWTVTGAGGTFPVTGTFWQATQPISAASLPLPSGAATDATVATLKAAVTVVALQVVASGDTTLLASGTRKIHRVEFSNTHASTAVVAGLKIASQNSGAVFGLKPLPVNGQGLIQITNGYIPVTSEAVTVNLSAAGQVEVTVYYE